MASSIMVSDSFFESGIMRGTAFLYVPWIFTNCSRCAQRCWPLVFQLIPLFPNATTLSLWLGCSRQGDSYSPTPNLPPVLPTLGYMNNASNLLLLSKCSLRRKKTIIEVWTHDPYCNQIPQVPREFNNLVTTKGIIVRRMFRNASEGTCELCSIGDYWHCSCRPDPTAYGCMGGRKLDIVPAWRETIATSASHRVGSGYPSRIKDDAVDRLMQSEGLRALLCDKHIVHGIGSGEQ